MFNFEIGTNIIISIGIQAEVKWRSVALGAVVVISSQNFDDFSLCHMFRYDGSVVLKMNAEN